jgi:hypothetical protein
MTIVGVILVVALVALSTLAVMNNACKSGQHEWCAPIATVRHDIKGRHGSLPAINSKATKQADADLSVLLAP